MPRLIAPLIATLLVIAFSAEADDLPGGSALYRNHCAPCHGADGEGTGPAARALLTPVPNLRTLAQRNGGVFPTRAVTDYMDGRAATAAHGDREMPIWGDVFRGPEDGTAERVVRERIAALIEFLKIIQEPARPAQR